MIHLNDALAAMKDKQAPFAIAFVTCSSDKKTGGEIIRLDNAVECGLPYKSKQRIGIKQLNKPKHSNDRIYGIDGISPTLNTMQGGMRQPFIADDWKIRRLTPTECERLQGFPDGWTEGISDAQKYKCLGNAVTVNVIEFLIERIYGGNK